MLSEQNKNMQTPPSELKQKDPQKRAKLIMLRQKIAPWEGHRSSTLKGYSLLPPLDSFLKENLQSGLHEIAGTDLDQEEAILPALFALALMRQREGDFAWISNRQNLYAPGLAAWGIDPGRGIFIATRSNQESLWAFEEVLRSGSVGAAIAELDKLSLTASRRLQLAAEKSGIAGLALRRWRLGGEAYQGQAQPIAALTRWRVHANPSHISARGISLNIDLWRQKGGHPFTWQVEFYRGKFHEIPSSLAQPFSHGSLAPQQRHA